MVAVFLCSGLDDGIDADGAGIELLDQALDGAAFAGGVRPLEDDHEGMAARDELALEGKELELILAELLLVLLFLTDWVWSSRSRRPRASWRAVGSLIFMYRAMKMAARNRAAGKAESAFSAGKSQRRRAAGIHRRSRRRRWRPLGALPVRLSASGSGG